MTVAPLLTNTWGDYTNPNKYQSCPVPRTAAVSHLRKTPLTSVATAVKQTTDTIAQNVAQACDSLMCQTTQSYTSAQNFVNSRFHRLHTALDILYYAFSNHVLVAAAINIFGFVPMTCAIQFASLLINILFDTHTIHSQYITGLNLLLLCGVSFLNIDNDSLNINKIYANLAFACIVCAFYLLNTPMWSYHTINRRIVKYEDTNINNSNSNRIIIMTMLHYIGEICKVICFAIPLIIFNTLSYHKVMLKQLETSSLQTPVGTIQVPHLMQWLFSSSHLENKMSFPFLSTTTKVGTLFVGLGICCTIAARVFNVVTRHRRNIQFINENKNILQQTGHVISLRDRIALNQPHVGITDEEEFKHSDDDVRTRRRQQSGAAVDRHPTISDHAKKSRITAPVQHDDANVNIQHVHTHRYNAMNALYSFMCNTFIHVGYALLVLSDFTLFSGKAPRHSIPKASLTGFNVSTDTTLFGISLCAILLHFFYTCYTTFAPLRSQDKTIHDVVTPTPVPLTRRSHNVEQIKITKRK